MRAAGRLAPIAVAVALLGLALTGCLDERAELKAPPGGAAVTIETADGIALAGRLWGADADRVLIYLHEYGQDQTAWWPLAARPLPGRPSVLTFDFRGHGASPGRANDLRGMRRDVEAALAFARARDYGQIVLVGAGMGAAAGMLAAAGDPAVALIGLSAPGAFGDLHPLAVAPDFAGRLALIAAADDLSAQQSFEQLRAAALLPAWRALLVPGRAHGAALLVHATEALLAFYERALAEFWSGAT